ncbi:hypothetical protein NHX12_012168 [Muraenolepis orangiensis]|uniref:Uncharacterized protein n=1 Tax=Muraenolepis orangiensis TaxID=630683 RepID=A0A9Q0DHT0_9TELE|nr:hypothetical protein NHX12_012168 [Muraenolepis orangiensis]
MMARNDADQWDSLTQGEFIAYDRETNRNAAPARSTDGQKTRHGALVKRLSRYGMHILPNSLARRSGIQRQPEVTDCTTADSLGRLPTDAPERGSLTSAMLGAFGANVDVMDYNGKRAWQYLKGNAPLEIQELLDTWDEDHHNTSCAQNASSNGAQCSPSQTTPAEDEVHTLDRNTRAGSWRLKYFRDLLPPYLFGNKC